MVIQRNINKCVSAKKRRKRYNQHRTPAPKYNVDDLVMLSSDGIRWPSESTTPDAFKLKYLGPLRISCTDHTRDNYTLEFPQNLFHGRFWSTFHVSHLKPYHNRSNAFPTWHDEYDRPNPKYHQKICLQTFAINTLFPLTQFAQAKMIRSGLKMLEIS